MYLASKHGMRYLLKQSQVLPATPPVAVGSKRYCNK